MNDLATTMNELGPTIQAIADQSCERHLVGIAIGVVVGDRQQVFYSGNADETTQTPVSAETIFEIGSITKVFTSLLLAQFVTEGRLSLDDPVQSVLPDHVSVPTDGHSEISYGLLATHRSSLPRLPDKFFDFVTDGENPYVDYRVEHLYDYLNSVKSVGKLGGSEEYSNLGVGLLGHALGRVDQTNYGEAIATHVIQPLGLTDTGTELDEQQQSRWATAHEKKGNPTKHWDFGDATVAAGGIRATLPDMMTFLSANLNPRQTPLATAINLTHQPWKKIVRPPRHPAWLFLVATLLAILSPGMQWILNIGPGSFVFILIVLLPVLISSYSLGFTRGLCTLALTTFLTWLLWGGGFGWDSALITGGVFAFVASRRPKSSWSLLGKGRLGWQELKIGNVEALWHNGMVGGSASFLGFIPTLDCGVVVLTNTGQSVDEIGLKVLQLFEHHRDVIGRTCEGGQIQIKAQIVEGDLLDQDVEVIVNARNRNIIPWWLLLPQGVSGAIKKRAGYAPFFELGKKGPIPLGGAVITGPGKLPFNAIIHVAGISMWWRSSERSIRDSVRNAIALASANRIRSIAFPLIGAGTGGGSADEVLAIMIDELGKCEFTGVVRIVRYDR